MDVVTTVITPVVECLTGVVKRHLSFYFYSNNVRNMRARIEQLNDTARDMETRKETNVANNLVVPHHVPSWLAQVETICEEAGNVPTGGIGCFNMKTRYKAGKQSADILQKIDDLETQESNIKWSDEQRPLGRVPSTLPSTSEPVVVATATDDDDDTQNGIKSRDLIFKEALKCLDPNNKTQKIALCGMGGVGKTTMMYQLKKAVEGNKMFDWVMKVVIGKSENLIAIQQTIAEYIGEPLTETQKDTRAERLQKRFVGMSEDGKKNILVILDDLWEEVDLKDIGLTNPLPKGFKLLLTSREENVCTRMRVEASSIFKIAVLEESEAKKLFWEIAGTMSDGNIDHELRKIGEDIVKKCGGLPIAIKTIASTLRDNSLKDVWVYALERLQNKELLPLDDIFKISYDNLKNDDEKATFLLSGLFPDDYNIPIEDLMRYGWGLNLFKSSKTISTARCRLNACVNNLVCSNLLIKSDDEGCVKMHDLVRDFVLSNFSNVKQASLVNSDYISEQLTEKSYERILLKCTGMREFPADFNRSNLTLLKLLDGDNLDTFPEDFYVRMEKLEVVAYDRMEKPLLQRYSTTLRTLCLHSCRSVGDISFIGDLINLEVLSFAFCGISKLPSAIAKLRKLKLLDLTECVDLCIDDGVFQSLDKLTELYMRAYNGTPIRFTEDSCEGLKMLSSKLIALDVEFFESIIQPKNVSFEKLERFQISMGCPLGDSNNDVYAYENTLKLVVSCKELLECKINELFEKTEKLDLSVNEMSSLEQISNSQHSFCNLRVLYVYECADLTSIFTVNVASSLMKLEMLRVSKCPVLESLVQGEAKAIKFRKLKDLRLEDLPMFVSLCDTDQVMELPQLVELTLDALPNFTSIFSKNNEISATTQPLFNKKIVIPNLEELFILDMNKLKEIWSCENTSNSEEDVNNTSMLRIIRVGGCDSLVNFFPCNPMRLLSHLAVINGQKQESLSLFHNLTTIRLETCKSIKYLFSHLMATHLSNLKYITVLSCDGMKEVVSNRDDNEDEHMTAPSTTTLFPHLHFLNLRYLPSLKHVGGGVAKYSQVPDVHWSLCQYSKEIFVIGCPAMSHVIPSYVAGQFLMVERLTINNCIAMNEVFATTDINNSGGLSSNFEERSGGTDTALAIPRLTSITAHKLSNLKTMYIGHCNSLEHIFTFSTLESLTKLEEISISRCKVMKVIVREENGEQTVASKVVIFPRLKSIILTYLPNLEGFFSGMNEFKWPLLDDVQIIRCPKMTSFTSRKSTAPKLKCIHFTWGTNSPESLNFYVTTNSPQTPSLSLHDTIEVNVEDDREIEVIFASNELLQLPNLEKIHVKRCELLKTVFEVESEVRDSELNSKSQTVVKFSKLREVDLEDLYKLKYIWKSNIQGMKLEFPNLTRLSIHNCFSLRYVFTSSMVGSLMQLQDLHITYCRFLKVIVEEEAEENTQEECDGDGDGDGKVSDIIVFPCLKSLTLEHLPYLNGFYLGKEVDVSLPSLNTLVIKECEDLEIFKKERVAAPQLKVIETSLGLIDVGEQDINSLIITKSQETPSLSLHDTIEVNVEDDREIEVIFASNELLQLPNLEKIHVKRCELLKTVFEVESEVRDSELNSKSQTVVKFSKLREVDLEDLYKLKYIWKSNIQGMKLEFPNLTRLSIHNCFSLRYVFTSSMVGSLMQLQDLHITYCRFLKVIVEEEAEENTQEECDGDGDGDGKVSDIIVFPCLKSLTLEHLPYLNGFYLGKEVDVSLPSLNTLVIKECEDLEIFKKERVAAPQLKVIETSLGLIDVEEQDINSLIITKSQEGPRFGHQGGVDE